MADVTQRMLALLATLQGGGSFSGADLAGRLSVTPRTLRRDVERLRGYGYPVLTRPGPGGSYRLGVGQRLPPLVLDDDEAVATIVALASLAAAAPTRPGGLNDAAVRAYGKIEGLLPTRLRSRATALRSSIEAERRQVPDIAADALGVLAEAIATEEIIVFDYTDAVGTDTRRRVEPHTQVLIDGRWYLFGWDLDRADWRVFRSDRITSPRRTGVGFTPRALPAGSAVAYLRSGLGGA
ncbi:MULTISPECIES: YafY family protein [unclassified Microbacterium]|uniref:helix-turn-helix transcriptional regulator n=1 Tax=unclassified Microbacterium TaxID=2609290 RepID=UPI000EA8D381|nr:MULTISPECIES: WYL domain-containing protein [unclassified Microbacterium]MBT2484702.1 WYL domain-containing protein [Microbacterium sp. ISL-108]RKN67586.1 WYL domain-containing protein [Microbacterium sp. CGR2]